MHWCIGASMNSCIHASVHPSVYRVHIDVSGGSVNRSIAASVNSCIGELVHWCIHESCIHESCMDASMVYCAHIVYWCIRVSAAFWSTLFDYQGRNTLCSVMRNITNGHTCHVS